MGRGPPGVLRVYLCACSRALAVGEAGGNADGLDFVYACVRARVSTIHLVLLVRSDLAAHVHPSCPGAYFFHNQAFADVYDSMGMPYLLRSWPGDDSGLTALVVAIPRNGVVVELLSRKAPSGKEAPAWNLCSSSATSSSFV